MASGSLAAFRRYRGLQPGATLEELEENVRDADRMMLEEQEAAPIPGSVQSKEIEVPV
jgi:hypothetical protein